MPRVKNVDCKSCNCRVTYEYAIHRQTFVHKLYSAKYAPNGSMIYYDSIDLDKTGEHLNVESLKRHNKEADAISKSIKKQKKLLQRQQQQKSKQLHRNFERQRYMAAQSNKHLLPKSKLNILQKKLAYEAEQVYQQQLATVNPIQYFTLLQKEDEDLEHFNLNQKQGKQTRSTKINKHTNNTLYSNIPTINRTFSKPLIPLANSTQLINNQSSQSSFTSDDSFTNAVVVNLFNNFTQTKSIDCQSINTNRTSDSITGTNVTTNVNVLQTSIHNTTLQHNDLHISQIPLPQTKTFIDNNEEQQVGTDDYVNNYTATENISFFTSFYTLPQIPQPTIYYPTDKHINHISSPMSPKEVLPLNIEDKSFLLQRIDLHSLDDNTNHRCRKCLKMINFDNLLTISDRMPKGKQIFCAPCLLDITSRSMAKNVDFYNC